MSASRRAFATLALIIFGLAALAVSAGAQLGAIRRATPRPSTAAAPPPKRLFCEGITPEMIEQLLKGLRAERAARERAAALEKASKAQQNANAEAGAQRMMAAMDRAQACEQAAMEKDPRYKELERLTDLRNRAQDRGDDAAADKYGEQFAALNDALEALANKACTSGECLAKVKEANPFQQQLAEARAQAARATTAEQKAMFESQITMFVAMIDSEAATKCGPMGAGLPSAAEQTASDAAAAAASKASDAAPGEGAKASGMPPEEYGRMIECAVGALVKPSATPLTPESQRALDQRSADLEPALSAAGYR